jgi:AcrR family transcriptional regulator
MLTSVNTMSSESRKYQLKARAESQRETRDRIARVAAELHEEKGPARTTVAEIARLAGVSRLTVYNHFPDLASLLPACSAHYASQHPSPAFDDAFAIDDPEDRVTEVLARLYGWYGETHDMWSKVLSDRAAVPELDTFLRGEVDQMQHDLATALADSLPRSGPTEAAHGRALLRLAVDFWTWQRLSGEGLDDRTAAGLMAGAVIR